MIIKQVVITAGGEGRRLRPLTNDLPKVMLPILSKPLLEHHVEQFKKHGVKEFFFTLCYLPQVIKKYFGDGKKWGVKINYYVEKKPLGTAGALKQLTKQLDDNFFYIYGDIFSLVDYSKAADFFAGKKDIIGLQRVGKLTSRADADLVELTPEGLLKKIYKKGSKIQLVNAFRLRGIFVLNKKILSYIPDGESADLGSQILPKVISAGEKFYGYQCNDYSRGIDTIEKLRAVEDYLRGRH